MTVGVEYEDISKAVRQLQKSPSTAKENPSLSADYEADLRELWEYLVEKAVDECGANVVLAQILDLSSHTQGFHERLLLRTDDLPNRVVPVVPLHRWVMSGDCGDSLYVDLVQWICHCGFYAMIVDIGPLILDRAPSMGDDQRLMRLVQLIDIACSASRWTKIWIRLPTTELVFWHRLLDNVRDGARLEVYPAVVSDDCDVAMLGEWKGEPIAGIHVSRVPDSRCLSVSGLESVLSDLLEAHSPLLSCTSPHELGPGYRDGPARLAGMQAAAQQRISQMSEEARQAVSYNDVLQTPLEPLKDNLDAYTYKVFMKDRIKYDRYREAISDAMERLRLPITAAGRKLRIAVLGAGGHGPLVDCVLDALESLKPAPQCHITALEKNKYASITLKNKCLTDDRWRDHIAIYGTSIDVFTGDMRTWTPPHKFDVIVSELLGSFGDNELSPECLDGAQRLLTSSEDSETSFDGVFIPQSSLSYIAPLCSTVLSRKVDEMTESIGEKAYNTPYVVRFGRVDTSQSPQLVWSFRHPPSTTANRNEHNIRTATRDFLVPEFPRGEQGMETGNNLNRVVYTGVAGYFRSSLYDQVWLSTHPDNHTPDMQSWFPILFPLRKKIYAIGGDTVRITMKRCVDDVTKTVWYEWSVGHYRNKEILDFQHCNSRGHGSSISYSSAE